MRKETTRAKTMMMGTFKDHEEVELTTDLMKTGSPARSR